LPSRGDGQHSMNATIERLEINAGNANLSYLKAGSGPVLLMMHGLMANAVDFKMQFEEFSSRRLCLAPDLPGFGMSREHGSEEPGLYVAADAMEAFIRELVPEGEKLDLLGHSFGSVVALELTSRIPEKLRSVTIVGAPTDMTAKPLQRALMPFLPTFSILVNKITIDFYSRNVNIDRRNLTPEIDSLLEERNSIVSPEDADSMMSYIKSFKDWVLPEYPSDYDIPTLIVHGAVDNVVSMNAAEKLASKIPNSTVKIIGNARHSPMYEQSEEFNRILGEFLRI